VKLDYADAPKWFTAGDVFRSLKKALPVEAQDGPDLWTHFADALSGQTGVNPDEIEPESPLLLSQSRLLARLADVSAFVWIAAFIGFCILLAAAF